MGAGIGKGQPMFGFYLASAIIGWAFVGLFLFGGIDSDVDADFEADVDVDFDADLDADLDGDIDAAGSGFASNIASAGLSLLSFRSVVFFLAFFGLTGIVLNVIDASAVATLIAAIGVGAFAWVFNSFVFRALKVADVSSSLKRSDLQGAMGEVVLPISPGHRGRIAIEVGNQRRYLTAAPHDAAKQGSFAVGDPIVVVDLDKGTALVSAIEVLES
jgi:membrane protein implicated in regulation of membrane protease activity